MPPLVTPIGTALWPGALTPAAANVPAVQAVTAPDFLPHPPAFLVSAVSRPGAFWSRLPEASALIPRVVSDVSETWAGNGHPLSEERVLSLENIVRGYLLAAGLEIAPSLKAFWDAVSYTMNQTAYPYIATPEESLASHLDGLRLLREKWGPGVFLTWREGDFNDPIRWEIGKEFFVTVSPGSHETLAGFDYRLHWEGADASGETQKVLLATVGVIRRGDGFGITLTQGGPRLSGIKLTREGRKTDLLKLIQWRFGPDVRSWLVRETLRSLAGEYGRVPVSWLRAERRGPLYGHIADPDGPANSLFAAAGSIPLEDLRERTRRSPSSGAAKLPAIFRRLNEIAAEIGFRIQEDRSWWELEDPIGN